MEEYVVSARSGADDLLPVGMAVHELLSRLPVTMRSLEQRGIRIENGACIDRDYTGPVLDEAIRENHLMKATPVSGPYRGVPVVVTPVRNRAGEAIAAIGIVDITGIFDLATLMDHQSAIVKEVCGEDPCPLPSEAISSKR